jgi:hypothetical protein
MITSWKTTCTIVFQLQSLSVLTLNRRFFFLHLLSKPVTEHTGQESYVFHRYRNRVYDFFPVGQCFILQNPEEEDDTTGIDY